MSDPLRTTTGRRRRRSATHAEGGQSLVVVLAMSLIILSLAGIAIQVTVVDGAATGTYVNTVQSRLAAETGINATALRDMIVNAFITETSSGGKMPHLHDRPGFAR